jgi:hypothetical protein
MSKEENKVVIKVADANLTRLAKKYSKLNTELKNVKEDRDSTLDLLRDEVLEHFDTTDEDKTRVVQTPTVRITLNKRTLRNIVKTDMEQVFVDIAEKYKIARAELDEIVENNSTVTESEVKPTLKVS